jgi:hypothetical protein
MSKTPPTPKTAGAGHRTPAPAPSPAPVAPPAGAGPDAALESDPVTRAAAPGITESRSRDARGSSSSLPALAPTGAGRDSDRAAGPRRRGSGSPADPAAGALPRDSAPAAGATPLRGKAWQDAVKAAESALHAEQRNARGRRGGTTAAKGGYRPGMSRRTPPGGAS